MKAWWSTLNGDRLPWLLERETPAVRHPALRQLLDEHRYAYNGKRWTHVERQGAPSRWVTLRSCAVLKRALG